MSEFQYNDILNMPYPNPEIEKDFPDKILRAAQFAPFAALTGYGAAVDETARLTDDRIVLDENAKAMLDGKLQIIAEHIAEHPEVTITYFEPDKKKSGGAYVSVTGQVKEIDEYERVVKLCDGVKIPIEQIFGITSVLFAELGYE